MKYDFLKFAEINKFKILVGLSLFLVLYILVFQFRELKILKTENSELEDKIGELEERIYKLESS